MRPERSMAIIASRSLVLLTERVFRPTVSSTTPSLRRSGSTRSTV